ncbi:MAG: DNA-binding response regulator [Muricauda sp.]|uniref:Transcriptional regulator n=1 Tax=Flagellimonas lutaonensis TaxID=516051 RepID=A0A0D5YU80_9FLAO|nr:MULTISPECIES: LytTR family DNA-binding domain-containing protein [Allomuricauda]AKA35785.1 transcriptional regulator [Allomuricauda lutaonensis]MAU27188.1 DNA-binding response regulator [Allomuricauda sp.]MBC31578.1 DNA-binding response regulator [Allomuricauda sp.]|tara:strand:- start:37120 stop:37824 length:705 start_codon:yes stop_codon:yes gene_type:complete
MNCIIIEDQPPAQRILKKYIEDIGTLKLKGVFSDAVQAMELMKSEPIQLLFLDIHLPKLSGIEFLKSMQNPPHVILTTAFADYALEGYELNVVDYLLKPFSFQRFVKAVSKVPLKKGDQSGENEVDNGLQARNEIYIKSGYEHIKIEIGDIHHIASATDYTEVITQNKKYLSNESLLFWLERLPNNLFYRIHKSHIINSKKIEKIVGNQVHLVDGAKVPIGRAYKENFMKNVLK